MFYLNVRCKRQRDGILYMRFDKPAMIIDGVEARIFQQVGENVRRTKWLTKASANAAIGHRISNFMADASNVISIQ